MKRLVALFILSLALIIAVIHSQKAGVSPAAKVLEGKSAVATSVAATAVHAPVKPEERERIFERLSQMHPAAELKEWRERQTQELARYDQMAASYDKAERVVRARVLSTQDPRNDRTLQRMNVALKQKLAQMLEQNKRLNQITAEFNTRLLAAVNKPSHQSEN